MSENKHMAEHTLGPWTVILRGERGTFHIPEAQKHEAARADDGVDGFSVSRANAGLIAAAPDLLAASQMMDDLRLVIESAVRTSDPVHHHNVLTAIKATRDALAKANAAH
jgi:hypothetical protein